MRIGPNHLSFTHATASKEIYGHRVGAAKGQDEFGKSPVFADPPFPEFGRSIFNVSRAKHAGLRKALAHSFSDSALRAYEPLVAQYTFALVRALRTHADGGRAALDIEAWLNYSSFDIVGDLSFGWKFGCIDNARYHPSIKFILDSIPMTVYPLAIRYLGFGWVLTLLFKYGSGGMEAVKKLRSEVDIFLQARLQQSREDLFEGLVSRQEELVSCYLSVFHAMIRRATAHIPPGS